MRNAAYIYIYYILCLLSSENKNFMDILALCTILVEQLDVNTSVILDELEVCSLFKNVTR